MAISYLANRKTSHTIRNLSVTATDFDADFGALVSAAQRSQKPRHPSHSTKPSKSLCTQATHSSVLTQPTSIPASLRVAQAWGQPPNFCSYHSTVTLLCPSASHPPLFDRRSITVTLNRRSRHQRRRQSLLAFPEDQGVVQGTANHEEPPSTRDRQLQYICPPAPPALLLI